jgi:hypothetical protein
MEPTLQQNPHDTAVIVLVGCDTSDFVLIQSKTTRQWRFPGDRIYDEDINLDHPLDRDRAARNTISRVTKERTGLTIEKMQRVVERPTFYGTLYGYAGLADFGKFAPINDESTKIIARRNLPLDFMPPMQRTVLEEVIRWIYA